MGVWRYSHGQISSLCPWLVIEEVRKERKLETKLIWCRIAAFSCSRPLCTMAVTLAWSSSEKAKNKQEPWLHQHPWCGQMDISIFFSKIGGNTSNKISAIFPLLQVLTSASVLMEGHFGWQPAGQLKTLLAHGKEWHPTQCRLYKPRPWQGHACINLFCSWVTSQNPNILGRAGG